MALMDDMRMALVADEINCIYTTFGGKRVPGVMEKVRMVLRKNNLTPKEYMDWLDVELMKQELDSKRQSRRTT